MAVCHRCQCPGQLVRAMDGELYHRRHLPRAAWPDAGFDSRTALRTDL